MAALVCIVRRCKVPTPLQCSVLILVVQIPYYATQFHFSYLYYHHCVSIWLRRLLLCTLHVLLCSVNVYFYKLNPSIPTVTLCLPAGLMLLINVSHLRKSDFLAAIFTILMYT